jgi:hypothetical protein
VGCWELTLESINHDDERPDDVFVCLDPTADNLGVGITTWAEGTVVFSETLVADGGRRETKRAGCRGWQSTEWSGDGHRLFMYSDTTCENDIHRAISGVSFLTPGATWVDIQLISSGLHRELVIRRYRPARREATEEAGEELSEGVAARTARKIASRDFAIEDIIEAARKVDTEVVEAALVENEARFDLDSEKLIALADSRVAAELIDLMVALSFPEQFEVKSRGASGGGMSGGGFGISDYELLSDASNPYAYWYPFLYAPFGYYSYGYSRYGGYYLLTPSDNVAAADSGGRVVSGRGYTRVWPKEAIPRRHGGGFTKGGDNSSSDGSSSSGGVGRGGYSGGKSSGRTAKPKNKN